MRKLALISSYCDSVEKLEILNQNIRILKSIGVDTFVISPIKVDVDCDYLFITKENPVLKWPERCIAIWSRVFYQNRFIKKISFTDDYGWASLYQIKKIMEFASTYPYDLFYVLIYDLKIDEKIIEDITQNLKNITYPRIDFNSGLVYPSSFHFAIFDKEKLKLMSSLMNKESYTKNDIAETYIDRCASLIGLENSKHEVTDLICLTDTEKIFNHSKSEKYGLFFNKDETTNFKIFFFNFDGIITVTINEEIFEIDNQNQFLETNITCDHVNLLKIEINQEIIDYTEDYKKIAKALVHSD